MLHKSNSENIGCVSFVGKIEREAHIDLCSHESNRVTLKLECFGLYFCCRHYVISLDSWLCKLPLCMK